MKVIGLIGAVSVAALVSSCGGGDGSSDPGSTTLAVTLSAPSANVEINEGGSATFGFTASYSGRSSSPVVADVQVDDRRYTLAGTPAGSGNSFRVDLKTVPSPAGGATSSNVRFRLCSSADCTVVYPGSTQTFKVNLNVALEAWGNFQRNTAHTGYVAVRYDKANFQKLWDWQGPLNGRIRPPAATADRVLITAARNGGQAFSGTAKVHALDAVDGRQIWAYDMGEQFHVSGPSLSNGMVHVTSMVSSSDENPQWVFDLQTGAFKNQMKFAAQWTDFNEPLALENNVYVAAGYYGSVLYGYDAVIGSKLFETQRTGGSIWGGQSMAADRDNLYYYSGGALDVVNKSTGVITKSIADPDYMLRVYEYQGAPVLDGKGNVFLFSSDRRFVASNKIMAMSLDSASILWRSTAEYTTAFAYRDGVIYAARNDAHVISALDAATGRVLWSTPLPGSEPITGNVIVTDSHAFVSSDSRTWAIDLLDPAHPIVWDAPTGGRLAITPGNLLLTTGLNRLTAYRLF